MTRGEAATIISIDDVNFVESDVPLPTTSRANKDSESDNDSAFGDQEWQESIERAEIVINYQTMNTGSHNALDHDEDSVIQQCDRNGFYIKSDECNISKQAAKAQQARAHKEAQRLVKWMHMLKNWPTFFRSPKMVERVCKGIPAGVRRLAWPIMLGVIQSSDRSSKSNRLNLNDQKDFTPIFTLGLYEQLRDRALLCSKYIKQIDLDINRTYRNNEIFAKRYCNKQQGLLHVLAAYSVWNTNVGYCQGMSHIAALLLMYMEEETAFWCLDMLMKNDRHRMQGFFLPGFPKLMRFQKHFFEQVLKKNLKPVYKQLQKENVPPVFITKWFFGCFLDRVPFSLALRLWDMYILYGDQILICFAYTIFKMHQKSLQKASMEQIVDLLQNKLEKDFAYSDDEAIKELSNSMQELRQKRRHVPPMTDEDRKLENAPVFNYELLETPIEILRMKELKIQSRHASRAQSMLNYSMMRDSNDSNILNQPVKHGFSGEKPLHTVSLERRTSDRLRQVSEKLNKDCVRISNTNQIQQPRTQMMAKFYDPRYELTNRFDPVAESTGEAHFSKILPRSNSIYDNCDDNDAGHAYLQHMQSKKVTDDPGVLLPRIYADYKNAAPRFNQQQQTPHSSIRYYNSNDNNVTITYSRSTHTTHVEDSNIEIKKQLPVLVQEQKSSLNNSPKCNVKAQTRNTYI